MNVLALDNFPTVRQSVLWLELARDGYSSICRATKQESVQSNQHDTWELPAGCRSQCANLPLVNSAFTVGNGSYLSLLSFALVQPGVSVSHTEHARHSDWL